MDKRIAANPFTSERIKSRRELRLRRKGKENDRRVDRGRKYEKKINKFLN